MAEKQSQSRSAARRRGIRKSLGRQSAPWRELLRRPRFGWAVLILFGYTLAAAFFVATARELPNETAGRIATQTRLARVDFELEDLQATEQERELRRRSTPRAYTANRAALDAVQRSLEGLPTALADAETLDQVAEGIRQEFRLDEERLAAIRREAEEGEASARWRERVRDLVGELRLTPLVSRDEYQFEMQEANAQVELEFWDSDASTLVAKTDLVNIAGAQLAPELNRLAQRAGFFGPARQLVVDWLSRNAQPTFTFDESKTNVRKEARAQDVPIITTRRAKGDVLYRRGEPISLEQLEAATKERAAYAAALSAAQRWAPRMAVVGISLLAAFAVSLYVSSFCVKLAKNTTRAFVLACLSATLLGLVTLGVAGAPGMTMLWAIAATTFFSMILAAAYEQRVALSLTLVHALLTALALRSTAGEFSVMLVTAGAAVWRLREIRQRNSLVSAGAVTGFIAAAASALVGFAARQPGPGVIEDMLIIAMHAGVGAVGATVVLMAALPTIEKVFNVTTGMTLIELRDPRQPLLRELQQRAPGTYSHSMTVATLAETAADAVGADGLELYVGALYHDVGKMNKPDYFVENQPPGFNRHEKLSPTMSLLVILGHVKDGVELAKEYGIPRSLLHCSPM